MANIHHHIVGRHRSTSTCMSIPEEKIRHGARILQRQIFFGKECREPDAGSD